MATKIFCDVCGTELHQGSIGLTDRPIAALVLTYMKSKQQSQVDLCKNCTKRMTDLIDEIKKEK